MGIEETEKLLLMAQNRQWQGLGDVINLFRTGTLGLPPLTIRSGAGVLDRLKVPYTYTWSQGLIPKPDDWKENIGKATKDALQSHRR